MISPQSIKSAMEILRLITPDSRRVSDGAIRYVVLDAVLTMKSYFSSLSFFQTHLELLLTNGDVVDATIKGARGRQSSARTEQQLKGDVARIRVIGCEERTNSEQAQYHFLLSSLTETSHTPSFVTTIWFPRKARGTEHRDEGTRLLCNHASQNDSILARLNGSQRKTVGAMLSSAPQDSLVIAHGIVITLFNHWPLTLTTT